MEFSHFSFPCTVCKVLTSWQWPYACSLEKVATKIFQKETALALLHSGTDTHSHTQTSEHTGMILALRMCTFSLRPSLWKSNIIMSGLYSQACLVWQKKSNPCTKAIQKSNITVKALHHIYSVISNISDKNWRKTDHVCCKCFLLELLVYVHVVMLPL